MSAFTPSGLPSDRVGSPGPAGRNTWLGQENPVLRRGLHPSIESETQRLRRAWASLRRPDMLLNLFDEFGLTPAQALCRADPRFVQRLEPAGAQQLFRTAAELALPLRLNSPLSTLPQRGVVHSVVQHGNHLRVAGPCVALVLHEDQLDSAWLAIQPTVDGSTSTLMLFDAHKQLMLWVGEDRPAGRPERCSWRQLLTNLVQDMAWNEV